MHTTIPPCWAPTLCSRTKCLRFNVSRDSFLRGRKSENCFVCHLLVSHAGFLNCQNTVAKPAEFRDYWQWKVLVSKEASHALCGLVLADLLFDLVSMRTHVIPSVGQIFRSQRRVAFKQLCLGGP